MRECLFGGPILSRYNGYRGKHYQPYNIYFLYAALFLFVLAAAVFLFLPFARFLAQFFLALGIISLVSYLLGLVPSFARLGTAAYYLQRVLLAGVAIGLLSLFIVEMMIASHSSTTTDAGDADYVIVLGAGLHGSTPSLILQSRLDTAVTYYKQNPDACFVVSGGKGAGEDVTEAEAMYTYLTDHGIPSDQLIVEPDSATSLENLRNSFALIDIKAAKEIGSPKIAVISNDFHLYRIGIIADRENRNIALVSAPTPKLYLEITYYIREFFALVKGLFVY